MNPGDLRRWKPIHSDRVILIVRIHGQKDRYCDYLEDGKIYEWVPVIDVTRESDTVNESR